MPQRRKYQDGAERQRAYRERKRNANGSKFGKNSVTSIMRQYAQAQGISLEYIRLAKRVSAIDPDARERLLSGAGSLYADAVRLGVLHRRTSVQTDDVRAAVNVLRRHYTADQILFALIERGDLQDEESPSTG